MHEGPIIRDGFLWENGVRYAFDEERGFRPAGKDDKPFDRLAEWFPQWAGKRERDTRR